MLTHCGFLPSSGPEGARAFAQNLSSTNLQWLGVGGNDLGDNGALYMAAALKGSFRLNEG